MDSLGNTVFKGIVPRMEMEETKPIRRLPKPFSLAIHNFGPIKQANIKVRPLTILIGPNNSGKSYTATLIYSLIRTFSRPLVHEPWRPALPVSRRSEQRERLTLSRADQRALKGFLLETTRFDHDFVIKLPSPITQHLLVKYRRLVNSRFKANVVGSLAVPLASLKCMGRYSPKVAFSAGTIEVTLRIRANEVETTLGNLEDYEIQLSSRMAEEAQERVLRIDLLYKNKPIYGGHSSRGRLFDDFDFYVSRTIRSIVTTIERTFDPSMRRLYYLPAARAGVAQTFKLIAAGIMLEYPLFGLGGEAEVQRYSGAIANLAGGMLSINPDSSGFAELADEFDTKMTGGRIKVRLHPRTGTPEIVFEYHDREYPIHAAASSVAELAPIILYIRHMVKRGSFIIIEEPEAHQHPESQMVMAQFLVRLIRAGANVLVTTHSDYLLESLSHYIRASGATETPKGLSEMDYLHSQEIGVYLFNPQKDGCSIVEPVEVDSENGIDQEEFSRVVDLLYGFARRIDSAVYDKTQDKRTE